MYKIAITGGIASGKSLVANLLKEMGELVVSCDDINKDLLLDIEYQSKLYMIFPEAVCDGIVDKSAIRNIIFNDSGKRERLNNIAHSEISKRLHCILDNDSGKIGFAEVPLLFECGMQSDFDSVWFVSCDEELRISRLAARDSLSHTQVDAIINCQMSEMQKAKLADVIIDNSTDIKSVKKQLIMHLSSLKTHTNSCRKS